MLQAYGWLTVFCEPPLRVYCRDESFGFRRGRVVCGAKCCMVYNPPERLERDTLVSSGHRRLLFAFIMRVSVVMSLAAGPLWASEYMSGQHASHGSGLQGLIEQGKKLVDQGRLAEAETFLVRAEELAPTNTEVLTLLGKVKGSMGELSDAQTLFRRVIQLKPRSAEAHVNLAITLSDAGEFGNALDETSKALSIAPTLATAHLNRARILADLNRPTEARAEFAITCRLDPGNPDGFYYWSLLERESGNLTKETILLQRVVVLQPQNDKASFLLGRSLMEQSRLDEAARAFRQALEINPNSSSSIYMLSRVLQRTDPEQAAQLRKQFETVKQHEADLEEAKTIADRGYAASSSGRYPEAIELFREALVKCGACEIEPTLHKDLGLSLCRDQMLDEGRAELLKALEMNPRDPDTLKALSIIGR